MGKHYKMGDYTNCRYNICEIVDEHDDIVCTVATDDAEFVIAVLEHNEYLKKALHLEHMASMFSTVTSFKGDVSERYKYSEETDTIYDTANHYGQYDKILDKKEITMLLNEYETVLKELQSDVK